jgi:prolyl oligopeptidase
MGAQTSAAALLALLLAGAATAGDDPHLWLEDVGSDAALAWVRQHNQVAQGELEQLPGFGVLRSRIREVL